MEVLETKGTDIAREPYCTCGPAKGSAHNKQTPTSIAYSDVIASARHNYNPGDLLHTAAVAIARLGPGTQMCQNTIQGVDEVEKRPKKVTLDSVVNRRCYSANIDVLTIVVGPIGRCRSSRRRCRSQLCGGRRAEPAIEIASKVPRRSYQLWWFSERQNASHDAGQEHVPCPRVWVV